VHEQAHIASALVFELSKVDHTHVREAIVGHLRHIDQDLARRVAAGLAFDKMPTAPKAAAPVQQMKPSPALQIIGNVNQENSNVREADVIPGARAIVSIKTGMKGN
jgi:catalase